MSVTSCFFCGETKDLIKCQLCDQISFCERHEQIHKAKVRISLMDLTHDVITRMAPPATPGWWRPGPGWGGWLWPLETSLVTSSSSTMTRWPSPPPRRPPSAVSRATNSWRRRVRSSVSAGSSCAMLSAPEMRDIRWSVNCLLGECIIGQE